MLELLVVFLFSTLITFIGIPAAIKSLKDKGIIVPDRYKSDSPPIPTQGAVVVVFCAFLTITLSPFFTRIINRLPQSFNVSDITELDLAILLVISMFALYGIVDDLIDLGWWPNVLLPVCFSFPLLVVFTPQIFFIPFIGHVVISEVPFSPIENFGIDAVDLFSVLIIPLYVTVVANLVNMHSGFNGLQSGLSSILLATIIAKCIIDGNTQNLITPVAFFGSIIAFWLFNRHPAKIFEGNIGSMVFGAIIGTTIIINEYYFFGVFILIPHILDFILWFIEVIIMKKKFVKFGKLRDDGTIEAPTMMKLKFLLPYYFRLKEPFIVNIQYIITLSFCLFGLIFL